ncbi:MAG TPA: PEP-CTERM sorting domain-containing protein [Roseateles sp.]|uniref:PEP-CTERM sorting domain-containing protein n=1 Tax=Roseateles sp. TaxID=1971397 RepID=UPI002EDAB3CE
MQIPSAKSALPLALCALLSGAPASAQFATNVIVNAGAEAGLGGDGSSSFVGNLPGWDVTGEMMGIAYALGCPAGYPCTTPANPGPANAGFNHFAGGNALVSTASQLLNLSFASAALAGDGVRFALSGWLGGYASQSDSMSLSLTWFSPLGTVLGTTTLAPVTAADRGNATGLLYREASGLVPTGSVAARLTLTATRFGNGSSNDGYADNLSLVLTPVPEPATLGLFCAGLLGLGALRLRRR